MADILIHLRRLILILATVYVSGVVCEDLTCSLSPRVCERTRYHHSGASAISASVLAAQAAAATGAQEDSLSIEIPRKFHLQLWIYIYSFLIYAVLVNFHVL